MNKFIKQTTVFIACCIFMLAALMFVPAYIVNKKSKFVIGEQYKIVLFGHSHPECAFNDTLIPGFKNLSHSAESYFYTYQKVKKVLSQNPQIETVLIEYSNNQIDEKMDDWTWGYKYMSNMFPQYASFMDKADIGVLIKNNPNDLMNCTSVLTRMNLLRIFTFNYNFTNTIGGYLRIKNSLASSIKPALNTAANETTGATGLHLSEVNIQYLQKIIEYCHNMHKKVYLVRSPQHKSYEYLKNEKDFIRIKNIKFAAVAFLDFNNFPLKDSEFADPGHLNYKGAAKFSAWFNSMLNSGLLNKGKNQSWVYNANAIGLTGKNIKLSF